MNKSSESESNLEGNLSTAFFLYLLWGGKPLRWTESIRECRMSLKVDRLNILQLLRALHRTRVCEQVSAVVAVSPCMSSKICNQALAVFTK